MSASNATGIGVEARLKAQPRSSTGRSRIRTSLIGLPTYLLNTHRFDFFPAPLPPLHHSNFPPPQRVPFPSSLTYFHTPLPLSLAPHAVIPFCYPFPFVSSIIPTPSYNHFSWSSFTNPPTSGFSFTLYTVLLSSHEFNLFRSLHRSHPFHSPPLLLDFPPPFYPSPLNRIPLSCYFPARTRFLHPPIQSPPACPYLYVR